jgi:hypothetical protein
MTTKKVWLKICQSFIQERSIRAEKLRSGPGITGKMHPTMPATAKRNPMMISATFKWFTYFRMMGTAKTT